MDPLFEWEPWEPTKRGNLWSFKGPKFRNEILLEIVLSVDQPAYIWANDSLRIHTHRIHVWYIYLHLVDIYGKCRYCKYTTYGSYGIGYSPFMIGMFIMKTKSLQGIVTVHPFCVSQSNDAIVEVVKLQIDELASLSRMIHPDTNLWTSYYHRNPQLCFIL